MRLTILFWLLSLGAFAQTPQCVFVITQAGGLSCIKSNALPPGPQGPTGATGATGAKGDKGDPGQKGDQGPAITGIPCAVAPTESPTLMAKLADGSCLPLIVVSPTPIADASGAVTTDKTASLILDTGGIMYLPSGWRLAGIVLPTKP